VHYYDLQPLYEEYTNLNLQYEKLKHCTTNETSMSKHGLNSYIKIIKISKATIEEKINNIKVHSVKPRNKRGLINGLGSIIKKVTGNLDANDGNRINAILNHLQSNQNNIQNQLKMQYNINHQIIERFNDTIQDIKYNELALNKKLMQIEKRINENADWSILFEKDAYNQIQILYNIILNILQDIENSLTFCKLKIIHPTIISTKDLYKALQEISHHYPNQLPYDVTTENILEFESIISVNCKILDNQIHYFLSVPIDYEKQFYLYYLFPIPTKTESGYVSIAPNVRYLLKSNDDAILPLNEICTFGKVFQCPAYFLANTQVQCEENILMRRNTDNCTLVNVRIVNNHFELIPEANEYLAIFDQEEKLQIKCQDEDETKYLTGIYLVKQNNCSIIYKQQEISFKQETHGKPIISQTSIQEIPKNQRPTIMVHLKKLNIKQIDENPYEVISEPQPKILIPSLWTTLLYLLMIACGCFLIFRYLNKKKIKSTKVQKEDNEIQEKKIQLPGEASF